MATFVPALVTDQPILKNPTFYVRRHLGPSSVSGRNRVFTQDFSKVVAILPDGQMIYNDPSHDGGYEAAQVVGTRLVYDYVGLEVAPIVFDVVVME